MRRRTGAHLVLGLGAALPVLDGRVAPDALVLAQVPLHLSQANAPALSSAALTNALTANQYATSFIVGDAFKKRFDNLGIPRRVLS